MTNGGDAAEQVVRLSLEGFEVAAKLSGAAAKNIAVLLVSVLKQEQKTKGKARLTNMIKSGKELKVFSIPNKDLKKFTEQAKRYGVLYCVLRDKNTKGDNVPIDIIARAEDASKIQRIVERFELGKVDKAAIPAAMNGKPSSKHGSKAVCALFVLREPFCKAIMTLGQLILTCFLNGTMKRTPSGHRAMYRETR